MYLTKPRHNKNANIFIILFLQESQFWIMLGAEVDSDFFFLSITCGTRLLTFSRKGLGVAVASVPPRSSGRFKNGMCSVSMKCLATV